MADLDTGIAAAPAVRPSVFTPPATGSMIMPPSSTVDVGVAVTPASRPNTFDDASAAPTADPGDILAN